MVDLGAHNTVLELTGSTGSDIGPSVSREVFKVEIEDYINLHAGRSEGEGMVVTVVEPLAPKHYPRDARVEGSYLGSIGWDSVLATTGEQGVVSLSIEGSAPLLDLTGDTVKDTDGRGSLGGLGGVESTKRLFPDAVEHEVDRFKLGQGNKVVSGHELSPWRGLSH